MDGYEELLVLSWHHRVNLWLALYRSGYLARSGRTTLEQIVASLEREATRGEFLAARLGAGAERETVLRLVHKLDGIGSELCDLLISKSTILPPNRLLALIGTVPSRGKAGEFYQMALIAVFLGAIVRLAWLILF